MSRHTLGTWEVVKRLSSGSAYGIWKDGALIADIAKRPWTRETEELANAQLIASAPNLLKACENCAAGLELFVQTYLDDKVVAIKQLKSCITALKATIAKAGKS